MTLIEHINQIPYAYIEKAHDSTLLFDFVESGACQSFLDVINNITEGKAPEDPSMVLVINYNGKRVREGVTYELNKETLQSLLDSNQISLHQQDSLIIGYQIDMTDEEGELFNKSKAFTEFEKSVLSLETHTRPNIPEVTTDGKTKIIVRNVGQGSWNELHVDNKTKLIFDIGTHYHATKDDILKLIKDKEVKFQKDKPGILISHWDIDHYHCLIGMTDDTIKAFRFLSGRNYLPTLTSRKVYSRFRNLSSGGTDKIFLIAPFDKPEKSPGYAPLTRMKEDIHNVIFFNSCKHSNRNQNAICIAIRKPNSSIVLPADTHYKQISNGILPHLNYPNNHYLVVPHHGGKAGKFLYKMEKENKSNTAIVSYGKNSYGHPNQSNIDFLKEKGFQIKRTPLLKEDFEIELN